jgi:hypothetical protein
MKLRFAQKAPQSAAWALRLAGEFARRVGVGFPFVCWIKLKCVKVFNPVQKCSMAKGCWLDSLKFSVFGSTALTAGSFQWKRY